MDNNSIVEGSHAVVNALRDEWSPMFSHRAVSQSSISQLLVHVPSGSWDWSSFRFPTENNILKTILATPDSGTGPDGIPNSAWIPLGIHGATILYNVSLDIATDCLIPYGFNHLRKCFVVKKKYITRRAGVAARSSDIRPPLA